MKLRNFLAGVVAVAMAFVGCDEVADLGAPSITLDQTEVTFTKDGGESSVSLTASRDWTVKIDTAAAKWLVVDPVAGKASVEAQKVTVSVLPNDGYSRETSVAFTIGMQTKYLTVKQDGEKGSADALILYANDMDNGKVEKVNDKWPYPDQSDSWRNEKGSGIANVKYASEGVSVRSVSSTNNLWFPAKGGSYFSIKDIALNSTSSLELMFDVVHGSPNGYKKVFSTSALKVFVSKDNANWVELPYDLTVKADNEFDTASAKFTVAGVENLSVAFQFLGAEDGYRLTRLNLLVYAGTDAAAVDFSKATAMDFGEGSTPGNDPGTGDLPEGTGEGTLESPYSAAKATNVASTLTADQTKAGVYIKGFIKSIKEVSVDFGNASYYLTDADGAANFYVFRGKYLDNEKFTSADQIKVGDEVVVFGDLINYMGNTPELSQGNYIVKLNGDGSGEFVVPESKGTKTVNEFLAAADTENYYTLSGEVSSFNSSYCSFDLTDASGSVYVYSVLPQSKSAWASKIANGGTITIYGKYTYFDGNGDETKAKHEVVDAYIVSYTPGEGGGNPGGGDDPVTPPAGGDGEYDPNITWTLGSSAYDNTLTGNNKQTATVNGEQVNNLLKLGTGSKVGDATLHIPAGTAKIGFYCVAWKGKTAQVKFSVGGTELATIVPAANAGATGNAPYTSITVSSSDYYEVEMHSTAACDVKVETLDSANGRVLFIGLKAIAE